jgi:hypothetical protein
MKKAFAYSLMVAVLAFVSCNKSGLEPLKGTFPQATEPALTKLVSSTFEKTDLSRIFTLQFSGENGASVNASFIGSRAQYYLEPGVYGPGESNLCFLVGGKTTVNGKVVIDGQISVKKNGDNYRFIFVLFDAEGKAYRSQWQGELVYEPDPEPVKLTELYYAQANVNQTVSVKVGNPGLTLDMVGIPSGDGCLFTADLYSPDGYLHEGTYVAGTAEATGPGQFTPGYPYDLTEYGMGIAHWGTCWWNNGNALDITSGTVEVAKKGNKWVITWGSEATYPNWAVFEGEIEALTPGDAPAPDYTFVDTAVPGASDSSWQPHDDVTTHYVTVYDKAQEEVAWFQLVLANETTDLAGEYEVMEYAHVDHTAGNGYDLSAYGYGIGGSRYMKNGELVLINPGEKITVTNLGGVYEFSGDGFDFVAGDPNAGGDDFDGTVLTQYLGAQDYTGYGIKLAALYLGTEGITVDATGIVGVGDYLKLEFYSIDGSLAAGEYEPCAEGGNVTEGTFGIGYDGQWGESGTTWYTVTAEGQTGKYVTDGHLSVSVEGDVYTIVLTSTTINAKYVGKLSAEL